MRDNEKNTKMQDWNYKCDFCGEKFIVKREGYYSSATCPKCGGFASIDFGFKDDGKAHFSTVEVMRDGKRIVRS